MRVPPWVLPVLVVLFAALGIFLGLFGLWGLPRLHHPVFEVEAFRSASVDGLWLSAAVEAAGIAAVAAELRALGARQVEIVEDGP